jgi:hypothetical protein
MPEAPQNSQHEKVSPARCTAWNRLLKRKTGSPDYKKDAEIEKFNVALCDSYNVDFSIVNGDKESGPYLDVVLYDDDQEVQTLPASFEKLEGTYKFYDSVEGRELVLILEKE